MNNKQGNSERWLSINESRRFIQDAADLPSTCLAVASPTLYLFFAPSLGHYQSLFVLPSFIRGANIYTEATVGFSEGNGLEHLQLISHPLLHSRVSPKRSSVRSEKHWNLLQDEWYKITTANTNFHKPYVQFSTLDWCLFEPKAEMWCLNGVLNRAFGKSAVVCLVSDFLFLLHDEQG